MRWDGCVVGDRDGLVVGVVVRRRWARRWLLLLRRNAVKTSVETVFTVETLGVVGCFVGVRKAVKTSGNSVHSQIGGVRYAGKTSEETVFAVGSTKSCEDVQGQCAQSDRWLILGSDGYWENVVRSEILSIRNVCNAGVVVWECNGILITCGATKESTKTECLDVKPHGHCLLRSRGVSGYGCMKV